MNETAEHESRFHDQGERVDGPYPQQSEHPLRSGAGKITDASGAPVYVFTEQVHTGAAWTNGTAPGQYVGASARDIHGSTTGAVDGFIHFWEQYDQNGMVELVCEVGYRLAAAEAATDPFTKDFWFHIAGDMSWADVDAEHDYRNRFTDTAMVWNNVGPAEGQSWTDTNIDIMTVGGRVLIAVGKGLQFFVPKNVGVDYEIGRCTAFTDLGTDGDFDLRVAGATGALQARSANYDSEYEVRARLRCGEQLAATDDYNIS